jgi:hypothetical protein
VTPRLTMLVAMGAIACGGGAGPAKSVPQSSPQETLAQFMTAVKANDLSRMGTLWGSDRGPAAGWMKSDVLKERLTVIQKYLDHKEYRVVEGPLRETGHDDTQTFRVELQRGNSCTFVFPMDLMRTKGGGWVVNDVHLGSLPTPGGTCRR